MSWNEAANSWWFWGLIIGGLAVIYFLPVIVGAIRNIEHLAIILMLNMFPIAWPAALAGAFMLPRKEPPQPYPVVYYEPAQYPYPYYTPAQYPPPGSSRDYWQ